MNTKYMKFVIAASVRHNRACGWRFGFGRFLLWAAVLCLGAGSVRADFSYADSELFQLNLLITPIGGGSYDYADSGVFLVDLLDKTTLETSYDYSDSGNFDVELFPVDRAWADSGSFSLNISWEGLRGKLYDINTGQPIAGAWINVLGYEQCSARSGADGSYELVNIPHDIPLQIKIIHPQYKTYYLHNVVISRENPVLVLDIQLGEADWQSLRLLEIDPGSDMTVMKGGTGYHYYQVVDEQGRPRNGITVQTQPDLGTVVSGEHYLFGSVKKSGIVRVTVPSGKVYDGQLITVNKLQGTTLGPNEKKSFTVHIIPRQQSKTWVIKDNIHIAASNFVGEKAATLGITLLDEQDSDSKPDVFWADRQSLLGGGVTASASVAAHCQILSFEAGGYAGASAEGTIGAVVGDSFALPYNTDVFDENLAKLDLLLFPTSLLDPSLQILQKKLESVLLGEYLQQSETGLYIKGSGQASAGLGIRENISHVGIAVDAGAEASILVSPTFVSYANGDFGVKLTIEGSIAGQANLHMDRFLSRVSSNCLRSVGAEGGYGRHVVLECVFNQNRLLEAIKIGIANSTDAFLSNTYKPINETEWTLTGLDNALKTLTDRDGIANLLIVSLEQDKPRVVEMTLESIINELDNILRRAENSLGISLTEEKRLLYSRKSEYPVFDVSLGASLGLKISVGATVGASVIETRSLVVQRSKLLGVYKYPLESYNPSIYENMNINLTDIYKKAINDVGSVFLQDVFHNVQKAIEAGRDYVLTANNSLLKIKKDIVSAGTVISNVFSLETSGLREGPSGIYTYGEQDGSFEPFGIGGIYHLEPNELVLSEPAQFSISYDESELSGFAAESLGMYRWDDAASRWDYVGGDIDQENNTVTAPIDRLGTYTLGVEVPYGTFAFVADPCSLPANGTDTTVLTSEIITNNDGTVIPDGTMFTVNSTGGLILTDDADPDIPGLQLVSTGGLVRVEIQATTIGQMAEIHAVSQNDLATIYGKIYFTDNDPPTAPSNLNIEIDRQRVYLVWSGTDENDLAGYRIYYDVDDPCLPFEGKAYLTGQDSPIDTGKINRIQLRGLISGKTYYLAVTAYDNMGNESDYSPVISFVDTLPQDSDGDGLPDDWELQYTDYQNGLNMLLDDARLDNDGDGLDNYQEYLRDSSPVHWNFRADLNDDGRVDLQDLAVLATDWLSGNSPYDIAPLPLGDGIVDMRDFALVAQQWLKESE